MRRKSIESIAVVSPGAPTRWVARCAAHLQQVPGLDVRCLMGPEPPLSMGLQLDAFLLKAVAAALKPADSAQLQHWVTLSREHELSFAAGGVDVVLYLGFASPNQFLDAANFWYFELTRPLGFSELPTASDLLGIRLVERTIKGATVLREGTFCYDTARPGASADVCLQGIQSWPASVIIMGELASSPERAGSAMSLARRVSLPRVVGGALRGCADFMADQYRLGARPSYKVGVVERPIHTLLKGEIPKEPAWIDEGFSQEWLADPFGVVVEGTSWIFAEQWDPAMQRGFIAVLPHGGKHRAKASPVLTPDHHCSYPYVFEHEGTMYMMPETGAAARVSLYRAKSFPNLWEPVSVLLSGEKIVDATPFLHEGRWWILGSISEQPHQLLAWYASSLQGPWTAHPANPIKSDARCARPAGTPFVHEGQLYRPAQDWSHPHGGAVALNRVTRLTPHVFREEVVTVLKPGSWEGVEGVHHISRFGDRFLIDAVTTTFKVTDFARDVRSKVKVFGRIPRRPSLR